MIAETLDKRWSSFTGRSVQWLFLVVSSIVYLVLTYRLSSPAPYLDDYEALLGFMVSVENESSWTGKIQRLFQQHNEHRIIIPRLIVWVQYLVTGELNFRTTILMANIFLVGIVFLLNRFFLSGKFWGIGIASVLLLMNYLHYENYQWALAGLQNYGVMLLALMSLVCCKKKKYTWMFVFAIMAALCSSSGILLLGCYAIYFIFRKTYTPVFVCLFLMVLFYVTFYAFNYKPVHQHPGSLYIINHPAEFLSYYFALLASYTAPIFRLLPKNAIAFGLIMFVLNIYGMIRVFLLDKKNILLYTSLFLNAVLLAIAYTRFNFGLDQAFASRYAVFSTVYFLISFSMLLYNRNWKMVLSRHLLSMTMILFSLFISYYACYLYKPYVKSVQDHLFNTICSYKKGENPDLPYIGYKDPHKILQEAEALGIIEFKNLKCP
jgi:hypothetical protein